jgi:2-polyprenyl-3-methyl-5-hydroxy-6-metoxy-1,4-benzoquinol methylase
MLTATPYQRFAPLGWDTTCMRDNPAMRSGTLAVSPKALRRRYPMRVMRYWFIHHFLRIECALLGRGLQVCEVGIDQGQLLQFVHAANTVQPAVEIAQWIGVDCRIQRDVLTQFGYTDLIEANVEKSVDWVAPQIDVIVLLHVLEHLYEPDATLARIAAQLRPGAVLVGGFPSLPQWLARGREQKIRANPNANGHVSAFSPARVRTMAEQNGLRLDFLNGAFFLRASGLLLENFDWWLRFNVAFGAVTPAWPGETYWVMRKPES